LYTKVREKSQDAEIRQESWSMTLFHCREEHPECATNEQLWNIMSDVFEPER
jgi:hypothetical protein